MVELKFHSGNTTIFLSGVVLTMPESIADRKLEVGLEFCTEDKPNTIYKVTKIIYIVSEGNAWRRESHVCGSKCWVESYILPE